MHPRSRDRSGNAKLMKKVHARQERDRPGGAAPDAPTIRKGFRPGRAPKAPAKRSDHVPVGGHAEVEEE